MTRDCIPSATRRVNSLNFHPLWVDRRRLPMHFWDPMKTRVTSTAAGALNSAAMSHAQAMMTITTIITTTPERGVSG
jgi:hypothetical protein